MRRAASFVAIAVGLLAALGACANQSSVSPLPAAAGRAPTPVDQIQLIEGDVTDRLYKVLGEVSVRSDKVRNLTFDYASTRQVLDEKLRAEAAKLGADAVIQVRYTNIGVTAWSWGSVRGSGRATAFDTP